MNDEIKAKVIWRDSNLWNEQTDEKEFYTENITSIGFVIHKSDDRIVLARDKIGTEWRGILAIPKENVMEYKEVES